MPVKKEPNGRRSIQVEVEVPGTPEEVWRAINTSNGISSWFVPTKTEERVGGKMSLDFGPGMESDSTITAWDPPHYSAKQGGEDGSGAPPMALSGLSGRKPAAPASSASSKACSPIRTTGTINSPAPNPAGPHSSPFS